MHSGCPNYTISNLSSAQTYLIRVVPHNEVSDQDPLNDNKRWCQVTATTREGGKNQWVWFEAGCMCGVQFL